MSDIRKVSTVCTTTCDHEDSTSGRFEASGDNTSSISDSQLVLDSIGRYSVSCSATGRLTDSSGLGKMLGVRETASEHSARSGETVGRSSECETDNSDESGAFESLGTTGSAHGFEELLTRPCESPRGDAVSRRNACSGLETVSTDSSSQVTRSLSGGGGQSRSNDSDVVGPEGPSRT